MGFEKDSNGERDDVVENSSSLKNITIDDIMLLRSQGRHREADSIMESFRETGRKNIRDGKRHNARILNSVNRLKRNRNGGDFR